MERKEISPEDLPFYIVPAACGISGTEARRNNSLRLFLLGKTKASAQKGALISVNKPVCVFAVAIPVPRGGKVQQEGAR